MSFPRVFVFEFITLTDVLNKVKLEMQSIVLLFYNSLGLEFALQSCSLSLFFSFGDSKRVTAGPVDALDARFEQTHMRV